MVDACVAMLVANPKEHAHDKRGHGTGILRPDVDDSDRPAMGISRSDRQGSPEGPPKTRPVVGVDTT